MSDPIVRRRIIVDRKFQLQYLYIWLWVGVGMVVMSLLFYVLGRRILGERAFDPPIVRLMSGMSGFIVLFCVLMGILSVFLTHRVAGAAYRLEKCIRELTDGEFGGRIQLRTGDYLQNVADALRELQGELREREADRLKIAEVMRELREGLALAGKLTDADRTSLAECEALLRPPVADAAVDTKQPPAV